MVLFSLSLEGGREKSFATLASFLLQCIPCIVRKKHFVKAEFHLYSNGKVSTLYCYVKGNGRGGSCCT